MWPAANFSILCLHFFNFVRHKAIFFHKNSHTSRFLVDLQLFHRIFTIKMKFWCSKIHLKLIFCYFLNKTIYNFFIKEPDNLILCSYLQLSMANRNMQKKLKVLRLQGLQKFTWSIAIGHFQNFILPYFFNRSSNFLQTFWESSY
jgi:hypothetical protein